MAIAAIVNGCFGYLLTERRYDVTSDPAWWGNMHRYQVLELKHDVLLSGGRLTGAAYKETDTYSSLALFHQNVTVEMFKANPGKYWTDLHLISKGTRLRCVKLERYSTSENSTYIVSGEILDGEFKGTIVEIPCASGNPHKKGSLRLTTYMVESVEHYERGQTI